VELFLQITGMSYLSERYPGSYDSRHKIAWDQMDSPGPGRHTRGLQFIGLLFVSDGYRRDRETIVSLLIYKEDIEAFKSGTYFTSYCPIEAVLGERVPRPLTPGDLVMFVFSLCSLFLQVSYSLLILTGISIVTSRLTLRTTSACAPI